MLFLFGSSGVVGDWMMMKRVVTFVILPLICICFLPLAYALLRRICRARVAAAASVTDVVIGTILVTMTVLQYPVASGLLSVFACVNTNGVSRVARDTSLLCWSADHRLLLAPAVPGLLMYSLIFPIAIALLFWQRRRRTALR